MIDVKQVIVLCALIGSSIHFDRKEGEEYMPLASVWGEEEAVERIQVEQQVTVTVYNAEPSQCWGDCTITASNKHIDMDKLNSGELRWCAVSRDLAKEYPFGSVIYLDLGEGNPMSGYWQVEDLMNKRFTNKEDLLVPSTIRTGKWSGTIKTNKRSNESDCEWSRL